MTLVTAGCKKEISTEEIDITQYEWEVKEVNTSEDSYDIDKSTYFRSDAYVLKFTNDTAFRFNTSVNLAGGNYMIEKKGKISLTYSLFDEVNALNALENMINEHLFLIINQVTQYEFSHKTLIFKGDNGKIIFTQKEED